MHGMGARIREQLDFVVVQPDAVREDHVFAGIADLVQIRQVAHVYEAFHIGAFADVFRSVSVQAHAVGARHVPGTDKQLLGAGRHKARREGVAQSAS